MAFIMFVKLLSMHSFVFSQPVQSGWLRVFERPCCLTQVDLLGLEIERAGRRGESCLRTYRHGHRRSVPSYTSPSYF